MVCRQYCHTGSQIVNSFSFHKHIEESLSSKGSQLTDIEHFRRAACGIDSGPNGSPWLLLLFLNKCSASSRGYVQKSIIRGEKDLEAAPYLWGGSLQTRVKDVFIGQGLESFHLGVKEMSGLPIVYQPKVVFIWEIKWLKSGLR